MNMLFVHSSEKLKRDDRGNYFTDGSYTPEVFDRYISVFKNVTTIFREDERIYENKYAEKNFQHFDKNRIRFIPIPNRKSSILSYIDIKKKIKINNIVRQAVKECDCLIARLPDSVGTIAIKFAKEYKKPYIIEVVGCPWDSLWNHSIKGKILAPSSMLYMKKSVKNSPYTIYVTNEFLQNRYPTHGKNMGCSDVSLPSVDESILERRLNKIKKMSENVPIVIGTTAAVNVRYKGQEYVIKAISHLNKEGHNYEYHLVGGGDNTYLRSVAEKYGVIDRVKFMGSLPHEKVFEYLDNIDIYIQPSKQEGLPRALVEAMSRGCPALGSTTGGIPELLNKEFIFNNGLVDQICEMVKKLDQDLMIEEAKRSFEKAKEYNKEFLDKKRVDFYKDFLLNISKL